MGEKYIPLYRKYRPKNIQEVVGQEHVKKALGNAINLNKISHAYLFTGPRGTGKTSIARILAKSLNCKEGPTLTPCEVCPSCVNITNSTPIDVIEIDAASNRKVEDTQSILEKVQYVPVNGKYKIYIIDEVHMLTNHAFNALLKTLEEPPENVIFILATTEPQKVLETITSRCQRFDFRRITTEDIVEHLKNVAKLEKIKIEEDAILTIAKSSDGGMRDSLALLDQVSVLGNSKTITSEDVNKILGRLSFELLKELSEDIISSNPQAAIELLEKIYNSGNEPSQILLNLLGYFKNLLVVKNCQGDELLVELTQLSMAQIKFLKHQSENIETHQITFLIEKIIYYIKEIKTTTNQHLWLEVAIIDIANLAQNTSLLELQERLQRLEGGEVNFEINTKPPMSIQKPVNTERPQPTQASKVEEPKEEVKTTTTKETVVSKTEKQVIEPQHAVQKTTVTTEETATKPAQAEVQSSSGNISSLWSEFLRNVRALNPPTEAILSDHAGPIELTAEKVTLGCESEIFLRLLSDEKKKKTLQAAAEKIFNSKPNLSIKLTSLNDLPKPEKKNPIIEKPIPKKEEPKEVEELSEEDDYIEHELSKKISKEESFSDQVSMVMNLFDGKYID